MLDIYICEDNKKQLELLEKYVKELIIFDELDMQLSLSTSDPYQILAQANRSNHTGLYFLDIELSSELNGLQLAQEIRRMEPRCFIIFITSHSEMSFLTFQYKVEALDFIIKDTSSKIKSRIQDCLLNVNEKHLMLNGNDDRFFTISLGSKDILVDYDDIIFFETSSNYHKVILHAKNRIIEFKSQLLDVEASLNSHFYRCHRSYIVNRDNIKEIDFANSVIHMVNGETCMMSSRMKKKLKHL